MNQKYYIDPDITKATTLPASFYRDPLTFEAVKSKIFYKSWQWIGEMKEVEASQQLKPVILLEAFLDEPLLLTRDANKKLHCLSNVCTHRGNLLVTKTGKAKKLICGYHGRRFSLDGTFEFMPEFKEAADFPKPCDSLHSYPKYSWGPMLFVGLNPAFDFRKVLDIMEERIGFMPLKNYVPDHENGKEYLIKAHWALYCDNYLEGFHIPFVHQDLNQVLDYGSYDTLLFEHVNLQIGYADETNTEIFEFPEGHIDYGKKIAAYYFWVFPNMMFNFYPWGLSLNVVEPLSMNKTRVRFVPYVFNATKRGKGAGTGLDKVEMEDEAVVEGVHQGVRSAFYRAGRFSPTREKGVHHFHRLLARFLDA